MALTDPHHVPRMGTILLLWAASSPPPFQLWESKVHEAVKLARRSGAAHMLTLEFRSV